MIKNLSWFVLGWLWLWLSPAAPVMGSALAANPNASLGQSGAICNVFESPYCVHDPGEPATFTYSMTNYSGETKFIVITQDQNESELIPLFPGQSDGRIFNIAAGTATFRLHPRGWCKVFNRDEVNAAANLEQNTQIQVDMIQGFLVSHQQTRAMIATLEGSLLAAVSANDQATINSLKKQITTLEKNDDKTLLKIKTSQDAITSYYGRPPEAEAIILELALHPFQSDNTLVSDGAKLNPGFRLLKNGDNDNNNGKPDFDDKSVAGEDELGQSWWFYARPVDVTGPMTVAGSVGHLRFYKKRTKGTPDTLPKQITDPYSRDRVFMEGFDGSVVFLEEEITITFASCQDRAKGTIDEILRVDFESADGATDMFNHQPNLQIGGNTNAGGGDRIFPDRNTPDGPTNETVKVKARIQPQRAGVEVFFKPYDVDDPSSRAAPVDDESLSQDNRGFVAGFREGIINEADSSGVARILTDGAGVAEAHFVVTRQPGDNFRVVAVLKRNLLDKLQVKQNDPNAKVYSKVSSYPITDNTGVPNLWKQSNLLTVWRQLHMELDSMAAPVGNMVAGNITAVAGTVITINQDLADVDMYLTEPAGSAVGRFTSGGQNYNITANTAGLAPNNVTIVLGPGQAAPVVGAAFTMIDDDVNTRVPQLPDIGLMQTKYGPAYLFIQTDEGGTAGGNTQTVAFALNVAFTNDAFVAQVGAGINTNQNRSEDFWVCYVQSGFQPALDRDADPNIVAENLEGNAGSTSIGTDRRGSVIFRETMRDDGINVLAFTAPQVVVWEQLVVVHETAHQFDLADRTGGIMNSVDPRLPAQPEFLPVHLDLLRRRTNSPGTDFSRGGP